MDEVFVKRMGGLHESTERVGDLEHWLFSLAAPPALLAATDESALRGAAAFQLRPDGVRDLPFGFAFTNNRSVLVGTSGTVPLQVPSLLGISHRAPFMHNGCAASLLDRFDPSCGGGDLHGHTSQLSAPLSSVT